MAMGTIRKSETPGNLGKVNLPTIKLDQTLSDLYKRHCSSLRNKRIAHIFCGTTCAADLSADFPRNRKYVYQDSAFNDATRSSKSDESVTRLLAPKYLSLVPQRDAFIAGAAPVLFFHSGRGDEDMRHDRLEAARTLEVLDAGQQPEVMFCAGPGDVAEVVERARIEGVSSKLVLDAVAAEEKVKMLVEA